MGSDSPSLGLDEHHGEAGAPDRERLATPGALGMVAGALGREFAHADRRIRRSFPFTISRVGMERAKRR